MTLLADYARVTRHCPCPICGKPEWCLISRGDPPTSAICQRVESTSRWGDAGWFHRLRNDGWRPTRVRSVRIESGDMRRDLRATAESFTEKVDAGALVQFAASLGLTVTSLRRLHIGWTGRAWSFPMSNVADRVLGIRLRLPGGDKLAIKGGREGLFIPEDLDGHQMLVIAEGPTDTAALLDLGFDAIGRPSCIGGMRLIVEFVEAKRPRSIAIVADADAPGQRGASSLACVLATHSKDVRTVAPPPGIKDARAWCNAGVTRNQLEQAIDGAQPVRLTVRTQRIGRWSRRAHA